MEWPEWWDWELELIVHVEERMEDREFSEVELRTMLEHASRLEPDHVPGRWLVYAHHAGRPWIVLVEPDSIDEVLVVITAFQRERKL
jgi:hypothetical protein